MTLKRHALFCPRHPHVRVELRVSGTAHCVRCGRPLRRPLVNVQRGLFTLEPPAKSAR